MKSISFSSFNFPTSFLASENSFEKVTIFVKINFWHVFTLLQKDCIKHISMLRMSLFLKEQIRELKFNHAH